MKHKYTFLAILIIFFLGCNFSTRAQVDYGSRGTDFWVTFGQNSLDDLFYIHLQIRIVAGEQGASGYFHFTALERSRPFSVEPGQVLTYTLTAQEKLNAYNTDLGVSDHSVHITSDHPVSAYAINLTEMSSDATNLLPAPVLGTDYYQISYVPNRNWVLMVEDAYAVIATEEGSTQVRHNNTVVATLKKGEVYYRTSTTDMTGAHITADKPVALFALCQCAQIPIDYQARDHLFQQIPPVNTWGKKFFVPATDMQRDRVRIVASQDGTNIKVSGTVSIKTDAGGKSSLNNLYAGQFVELEISIATDGCYVSADKPVAVCAYLLGSNYVGGFGINASLSDPSQAWIAPVEQNVKKALLAPFSPKINPGDIIRQYQHYALIVTATATKANTRYKIGAGAEQAIGGVGWHDHATAGLSFYSMKLSDASSSYLFSNSAGLVIMGYGVATDESYYYLLSSGMRDLDFLFYVNDIHFQEVSDVICEQPTYFRAEINGGGMTTEADFLKWYINGVEEVSARNKLTWEKTFAAGVYQIKMEVMMANGTTKTKETSITVEKPVLTPPGNLIVCAGDTVSSIAFTGTQVSGASWTATNGTAIGLPANSGTGNIGKFTARNTGSSPLMGTITVTPKSAGGCEGKPETFTITVNPSPTLDPIPNKSVCAGETVPAVFFTGVNINNITWTTTGGTTIGMPANSGTGNTPSFTARNTLNTPLTATITITPKSSANCVGASQPFLITVNPLPVLNTTRDMVLCAGDIVPSVSFTGLNVSSVTWTASGGTDIGMPANGGTGNMQSFTARNTTNSPLIATITVTPKSADNCVGETQTLTITVNPLPVLTTIQSRTFCAGDTVSAISFTGTSTSTITWVAAGGTAIGMPANGTGNIESFTAINATNNPLTATITVTPKSAAGCEGTPQILTITVNPLPALNPIQDMIRCAGGAVPAISFTGNKVSTVTWEAPDGMMIGMAAESGTETIPSFIANNTSNNPLSVTVTAKPKSAAGCEGKPLTFIIKVYGQVSLDIDLGNDTAICWLDSLRLKAIHPEALFYRWQDGSNGNTYTVFQQEGQYYVTVKGVCDSRAEDTINISYLDNILLRDTTYCITDLTDRTLDVTNPYASYEWWDGSTSPVHTVEEPGIYSVTVTNVCTSKTGKIEVIDCNFDVNIPNIFTPNGDGLNELFAPQFDPIENLGEFQMYIYNRWGRLVFSTESYQKLWDGNNTNGQPYPEGVYYYHLYFTHKILKNKEYKYHGTITLIR